MLKEFYKNNKNKVKKFHAIYSMRDKEGKVHCAQCPYEDHKGYHCIFSKYLDRGK